MTMTLLLATLAFTLAGPRPDDPKPGPAAGPVVSDPGLRAELVKRMTAELDARVAAMKYV